MSDKPDDRPEPAAETPALPDETDTTPPAADSPDTDGSEAAAAEPAAPGPGRGGAVAGLVIAILALLLAGGGLGGAWWLWQQQQALATRLAAFEANTDGRLSGLDEALADLRRQDEAIARQVAAVREEQQAVSDALSELLRRSAHLQKQWLVAEARYLVRLAGQRLGLARDVKTALAALRAADARLREVGDPAIVPVRKALAEDIDALEQVPAPDVTGLALRLGALIADVEKLPLIRRPQTAGGESEKPAAEGEGDAEAPVQDWRELPAAMWEDLKKLVVIRHHADGIKPLLSPDQHFFLIQNLKLQLEQARLALLEGDAELWRASLDTARRWLDTWFEADDPATAHLRQALAELAGVNIAPPLPTPSRSDAAIAEYLARTADPEPGA